MSTTRQVLAMLRRNQRGAYLFVFTMSISIGLLFLFVNLQDYFMKDINPGGIFILATGNKSVIMMEIFILLIAAVCIIQSFSANAYFFKTESKELYVYLCCGMNILSLAKFLIIQNVILFFFATIFGSIIGILLNPLTNMLFTFFLKEPLQLFTITPSGSLLWAIILFFEFFFMMMLNIGYAYKSELKNLMGAERQIDYGDTRFIKTPSIIYIIAYGIAMIILLFLPVISVVYLVACCIALYSIFGLFKYIVPKKIEDIKLSHKKLQSHHMIIQGNLYGLLNDVTVYILMLFAMLFIVLCFLSEKELTVYLRFVLCLGFLFVVIMMAMSVYSKLMNEAEKRQEEYHHLELLGFFKEDLRICIKKELIFVFSTMLLLPMPFVLILLLKFTMAGILEFLFVFLLVAYIVIIIITACISIVSYQKKALEIEGE